MFELFFKQSKQKLTHSQFAKNSLEKRYQELVVKHHIHNDNEQIKVLGHLQQLLNDITWQIDQEKEGVFDRFLSYPKKKAKSLYIFGDVGRGKSMLMNEFFKACPMQLKRRVHFHAFMQEVHGFIDQARKKNENDPILWIVLKIKKTAMVLCFDEFHVTDIADAMLLSRLFTQLSNEGVIFVATSNQHPDELYKNGLQRELFLPFIEFLKQTADVLELVAKEDYRMLHFLSMDSILSSDSATERAEFLKTCFNELTNHGSTEAFTIRVKGRKLQFLKVHGDILLSSFEELCGRKLGPADYLAIANEFSTVLIADIPILNTENRDKARRFVTLIDTLYEKNVKLICTMAVSIEQLNLNDRDFDLSRTQSRLYEMQTEKYIQNKHLT